MAKINLEDIFNSYVQFNKDFYIYTKDSILLAMKMACKQALELAAKKAELKRENYSDLTEEEKLYCLEIYKEEDSFCPSEGVVVDKYSILNVINLIK